MFRALKLTNDKETVTLNGQFSKGFCFALLPLRKGICKYTITVHSGKLRLNQMAFNSDGNTWSCFPNGRQVRYDLQEGQSYNIQLTVGESFNQTDKVEIINMKMLRKAIFSYEFE